MRYLGRTIREGSAGKREDYREKSEQSFPGGTEDPAGGGEINQEIISANIQTGGGEETRPDLTTEQGKEV